MSFLLKNNSKQTMTLPRQDTATTVSSLSTSCSNLETSDFTSNASTLKFNKTKRRRSVEHFMPFSSDVRTLKTLKVHYYPEEQCWSFIVVIVSSIVQMIVHGLQLSYGIILVKIFTLFGCTSISYAGE
jgi:hypothetical protein